MPEPRKHKSETQCIARFFVPYDLQYGELRGKISKVTLACEQSKSEVCYDAGPGRTGQSLWILPGATKTRWWQSCSLPGARSSSTACLRCIWRPTSLGN